LIYFKICRDSDGRVDLNEFEKLVTQASRELKIEFLGITKTSSAFYIIFIL